MLALLLNRSSIAGSFYQQRSMVKLVLHPKQKGKAITSCLLPPHIEPKALAKALKMSPGELCKHARALYDWYPTEEDIRRVGYTSNQVILSYREAERVALRAGITPSPLDPLSQTSVQSKPNKQNVKPAETQIVNRPRPALISVMGHANHGKTSLLDALRGTNVVAIEPGNITQQLYVFRVDLNEKGNNKLKESDPRLMSQQDEYPAFQYCTCLESPGQAIFQSLREQAGEVCDIVVLLIDINDGIQEQTLEVLDACIEARVPLLIAFNKMDSENAAEKLSVVKAQLTKARGLHFSALSHVPGSELALFKHARGALQPKKISTLPTFAVQISAKSGQNLSSLKTLLKELIDRANLTADVACLGRGTVIDSFREAGGRGRVVRVVLHEGTVKIGQACVAGENYGRVRGIRTCLTTPTNQNRADSADAAENLTQALPGDVVELMCFKHGLPEIGSDFHVCQSDEKAEEIAQARSLARMYPLQERFSDVDAVKATADNVANTQRKMLQKQQFRERAVEQQSSTKIEESNSDDASEEVEPKHRTVVPVIIRAENAASLNVIVEYFLSLHEQPHSLSRLDSASDQALRRSLENKHGVPTLHKRKQARASAISELEATEQASQAFARRVVNADVQIVAAGVGPVVDADIDLARTVEVVDDKVNKRIRQSCPIYVYSLRAPRPEILQRAKEQQVDLRYFNVLPELLDDACDAINFYKNDVDM